MLCYYLIDYLRIDFESVMERATNKIGINNYNIYICILNKLKSILIELVYLASDVYMLIASSIP